MTWVRLDDAVPTHPKLLDAGAEAAWFWVASIAYANRHTTDGWLSKRHLEAIYPPLSRRAKKLAKRLADLGLLEDRGEEFYYIHDYEHFQEDALSEQVEERRKEARERKRRERQRKRKGTQGGSGGSHAVTGRDIPRGHGRDVPRSGSADKSAPPVTGPDPVPADPGPSSPSGSPDGEPTYYARAREDAEQDLTTWLANKLAAGFKRRYEEARGLPWMSHAKYEETFRKAALWCIEQSDREGRGTLEVSNDLLNGLFSDEWCIEQGYPPGQLSSKPGELYSPPQKRRGPARPADHDDFEDDPPIGAEAEG